MGPVTRSITREIRRPSGAAGRSDLLKVKEKDKSRKDSFKSELLLKKDSLRSQSGAMVCRICLSEDTDSENPLISPCKCAGTMKLIHI